MKRVLALALALVLSLSMGVVAFAAEDLADRIGVTNDKTASVTRVLLVPGTTKNVVIDIIDTTPSSATFDKIVLDAYSAALAWEDGYLKVTPRIIKGAEYVKSAIVKKNAAGQLIVEVKSAELYLPNVADVDLEIKIAFAKVAKIGESLADYQKTGYNPYKGFGYTTLATATQGHTETDMTAADNLFGKYTKSSTTGKYALVTGSDANAVKNNDYFVYEKLYTFGFGLKEKKMIIGSTPLKDDEVGTTSVDYDADLGWVAQDYIHLKGGIGDTFSFTFGDNAYAEVKVSDNPKINMYYSEGAIKALTSKFVDTEFQFWNWKGNPTFDFTATLELTVDEDLVGETPVLYTFDGTNYKKYTNFEYDDGVFTIKTRELGAFFATNKELPAASAPLETTAAGSTAAGANTGNPKTGVSDFVGVAVALAVVSMAAAGAVALKK